MPARQPKLNECKARMNRARLSTIIADVIFAEDPTATLAASQKPHAATIQSWKRGLDANYWTLMDQNPFATVSRICVCFVMVCFYRI
jgi:hypothetical protein